MVNTCILRLCAGPLQKSEEFSRWQFADDGISVANTPLEWHLWNASFYLEPKEKENLIVHIAHCSRKPYNWICCSLKCPWIPHAHELHFSSIILCHKLIKMIQVGIPQFVMQATTNPAEQLPQTCWKSKKFIAVKNTHPISNSCKHLLGSSIWGTLRYDLQHIKPHCLWQRPETNKHSRTINPL